jgi:type I restriction enzyme S subunit
MVKTLEFQKERNFKKVEANGSIFEIPEEWKVFELKDGRYFRIIQGENYPIKELKEEGYPVFGANGIIGYGEKFHYEKPVVVVTCRGSTCGSVNLTPPFTFVTHNAMAILPVKNKEVDTKYLYYVLTNTNFRPAISGTGQPQITKTSIAIIKIPLPSLSEQLKIAHVLTTIDKAIEEVEKVIKKAERIKKGLMQELLTKGIGHKEFKDTEIGRIPKEWKVVKLKEVAKVDSGNTAPQKEEHFIDGKYPFIRMQHLNVLKENKFVKHFDLINEKAVKEKKLKLFKKGSILLPKSGESIRTEKKAMLEFDSYVVNHLAVVEVEDTEKLDSEYLFYYFKHFNLSSLIMQTTTPSINLSTIREIKVSLPPLEEQKKIAEILSKWDKVIELKKAKKEKLERMKKKVMELLLTGKVRVK